MPLRRPLVYGLFFASGFAGLVYQVLWMRELGRLFGNTAHASATTLAAFFLGVAAGSLVWGRRAARMQRPLVVYAWLEAGVAASALGYFAILDVYAALYAPLYAWLGASPAAFLAAKFALALAALLPPAFFMGGTLPAISQYALRAEALGRGAAGLYALNTLGAALGAWLTGFALLPRLGVHGAFALAIATSAAVAGIAARLGRTPLPAAAPAPPPAAEPRGAPALGRAALGALAFGSGLATLALELLWTRMFAQVLQNSVYTFALVLAVFLVALGLGAWLARALMRRGGDPARGLAGLLLASGLAVAASPWLFAWESGGLDYLGGESGWWSYVARASLAAARVLLVPGAIVGSVFPFLLRAAQPLGWSPGRAVGELAAQNTLGAVAGSLLAGFVLLDAFGLWASLELAAVGYLGAALCVAARRSGPRPLLAAAAALALIAVVTRLHPSDLPRVRIDAELHERVVDVLEGSGGTVAVIDRGGFLRMKLDNHYGLGGSDDVEQEERQALLPLLLHPRPRSAFFLGLGSGITAGAALRHPLERVRVAEISPQVVEAARRHFHPWLNGLFEDPRARVLAEDARNFLSGSRERFDVIVCDLLLPWLAGAGSLYTVETYRAARERLEPGGLYAQWLPLFQLSRPEFEAIAHTMAEVFPQLTLWRGGFRASRPIALLLGSVDAGPLDPEAVRAGLEAVAAATGSTRPVEPAHVLLLYQGNLGLAPGLFAAAPVERDARPRIEFGAAVAHREKRAGRANALVEAELVALGDELFARVPPRGDPFLARVGEAWRDLPEAGLELVRAEVLQQAGDRAAAREARSRFTAVALRAGLEVAGGRPSPPREENESSSGEKTPSDKHAW